MKNIKIICLLYFLLLIGTASSFKAQAQEKKLELKNLRYGQLVNGLTYFIKDVEGPEEKTLMRFYIKVGAYQEDIGQLQIAHLLEHVAFKPTENFPKGIKNEILKLKMTEQDVEGNTPFKCTRYLFEAPSQNKQAIMMGLSWFKDIAIGLKLTDKNINQERGAVRQEFIYGELGGLEKIYAEKNLEAKLFPCRSSFDSFLKHVQTFPNENLRHFYKDWYRPDLMGIVITGNIQDMAATERLVKSVFKNIPEHNNPRKKIKCDSLYFAREPQFAIAELKGVVTPQARKKVEFRMIFRQPELAKRIGTKKGYKQYVVFQLLMGIMWERFYQKQVGVAPYQVLARNSYRVGAFPLSYTISFKSEEYSAKKAFGYVFTKLHQLRKYGVSEKEWILAKEKYTKNRKKEDASYWQKQWWFYFVKGEALFANKQKILQQWVQSLSVHEFNGLIKQFLVPMPQDIGIIAPTGNKALQYTENQVRSWIEQINQQPVVPYRGTEVTRELLTSKEVAELKKEGYKDLGLKKNDTQKIILENGIKVVLKPYQPTKGIGDDRIRLHGFSKTGAACFPKKDYYSALNAPSIVAHSGVGRFNAAQLKSFMEFYNIASCTPYIDFKESGIHGLVNLGNVEELLQLVYLYYAQPEFDAQEFKDWKMRMQGTYKHQIDATRDFNNKIRHFFQDSILPPTYGYRYLKSTEAYNSLQKTNGKRSLEIYRQIFGQPQEFTFIISGDFKVANLLPLLQKYLGNIAQNSNKETCENSKKIAVPIKKGPINKQFVTDSYQMESVKYDLTYMKQNIKNNPWKETLKIRVLGKLIDIMLKRLRYEKGFALYNFGASGKYNPDQSQHKINFDITCQAEELKAIQQECQKIIQEIKRGEIKKENFQQAIKGIQKRYAKQTLLRHRNMQKLLYEQLRYEKPWVELEQYDNFLRSLDIQDMIEMSNKYFKKKNKYEFVMGNIK